MGHGRSGQSVTLTRTPCYGTCPDYTVTLHRDGAVDLSGGGAIVRRGTDRKRVSADAARSVFALADSVRFHRLPASIDDHCPFSVTDLPGVRLAVRDGAGEHQSREQGCGTLLFHVYSYGEVVVDGLAVPRDSFYASGPMLAWAEANEDRFVRESYLLFQQGLGENGGRPHEDPAALLRADSLARDYTDRLHTLAAAVDSATGAYEWASGRRR